MFEAILLFCMRRLCWHVFICKSTLSCASACPYKIRVTTKTIRWDILRTRGYHIAKGNSDSGILSYFSTEK